MNAPADKDKASAVTEEAVRELLKAVIDPELHYSIVDVGLVYGVTVNNGMVTVKMTLTSPGCPYGPALVDQVRWVLQTLQGVKGVKVDLVFDPPWSPERMTEEVRLELGFDV